MILSYLLGQHGIKKHIQLQLAYTWLSLKFVGLRPFKVSEAFTFSQHNRFSSTTFDRFLGDSFLFKGKTGKMSLFSPCGNRCRKIGDLKRPRKLNFNSCGKKPRSHLLLLGFNGLLSRDEH